MFRESSPVVLNPGGSFSSLAREDGEKDYDRCLTICQCYVSYEENLFVCSQICFLLSSGKSLWEEQGVIMAGYLK